jgi:hypothetical protein
MLCTRHLCSSPVSVTLGHSVIFIRGKKTQARNGTEIWIQRNPAADSYTLLSEEKKACGNITVSFCNPSPLALLYFLRPLSHFKLLYPLYRQGGSPTISLHTHVGVSILLWIRLYQPSRFYIVFIHSLLPPTCPATAVSPSWDPRFCSSQNTLLFYFISDTSKELKYEDKIAANSLRGQNS